MMDFCLGRDKSKRSRAIWGERGFMLDTLASIIEYEICGPKFPKKFHKMEKSSEMSDRASSNHES